MRKGGGKRPRAPWIVDLAANTVNGKRVLPRVAELVHCLVAYPGIGTDELIRKLFGILEPEDAGNTLKQTAHNARRAGIPVVATHKGRGARYIVADPRT